MIERREYIGFALETGDAVGISAEAFGDDLEGDVAPEFRIPRPIHLAHAAGPEGFQDLVRAKSSAGRQAHRWGDYKTDPERNWNAIPRPGEYSDDHAGPSSFRHHF